MACFGLVWLESGAGGPTGFHALSGQTKNSLNKAVLDSSPLGCIKAQINAKGCAREELWCNYLCPTELTVATAERTASFLWFAIKEKVQRTFKAQFITRWRKFEGTYQARSLLLERQQFKVRFTVWLCSESRLCEERDYVAERMEPVYCSWGSVNVLNCVCCTSRTL